MTASLLLLALVRSGNGGLIPGGLEELVGPQPGFVGFETNGASQTEEENRPFEVGGRFKRVFAAFQFWGDESPDMQRTSDALLELVKETVEMMVRIR